MSTFNTLIVVVAGSTNTGLASSILVTIYDNAHNTLVSASNAPGGTAFAESATPGTYWAPYAVDTSKLPVFVEPSPLSNGALTYFPMSVIDGGRAAQVADGYTAALATNSATTNTRVDATISSRSTFAGGAVSSVTGNVGGNVLGSVAGSVGSISGITFPSNFGTFAVDGSGNVTLTSGEHTAIADDVLDASLSAHAASGSVGAAIAAIPTASAIASAVLAAAVDGTVTLLQAQALQLAIMTGKYTTSTTSGTTTTNYYAQDGTTLLAVSVAATVSGTTTRTWTFSNLP